MNFYTQCTNMCRILLAKISVMFAKYFEYYIIT